MNLPSIDDYINALHFEGALGQYSHLEPVKKPDGSLTFSSGNFAVVFKMKNKNTGEHSALKVFHRYQEGRKESYQLISESLSKIESPYLVKYNFLEKEIWVNSALAGDAEYPAIIMDWIEGQTLGHVLQTLCSTRNQYELKKLAFHFDEMALWLLNQEFAHGDLKSDNILVLNDGSLKLVDYDGLYTPAMKGQSARENGSPHFRHPKRDVQHFGAHIDDFSLLLLSLSLHTLAENPSLISQHGAGDSILLTESELNQPGVGPKWQSLIAHLGNTTIAPRFALILMACANPAHLRITGLEPVFKIRQEQGIQSSIQTIVSTIAGNGEKGDKDGKGIMASFNEPCRIALDSLGNLFVAEHGNNKIRKITPDGMVSTFAGNGKEGNNDGKGILASFNCPTSIAIDSFRNLFVADQGNNKIRKITPDGLVSTFAGNGKLGDKDGKGDMARFSSPIAIDINSSGNLFVADCYNHKIRKITPDGMVTTISGNRKLGKNDGKGKLTGFNLPMCIAMDSSGNLFVGDEGDEDEGKIRKISPDGTLSTIVGNGDEWDEEGKVILSHFCYPSDIAIDSSGNLFVADLANHLIRKITPDGKVTTIAGNSSAGAEDGRGVMASFNSPSGIAIDSSGNLFVADFGNNLIRKITFK